MGEIVINERFSFERTPHDFVLYEKTKTKQKTAKNEFKVTRSFHANMHQLFRKIQDKSIDECSSVEQFMAKIDELKEVIEKTNRQ